MKNIIWFSLLFLPICVDAQSNFSTSNGIRCTQTPSYQNEVTVTVDKEYRIITSNSIPDHTIGRFPNRGNPNTIAPQKDRYRIPLNPKNTGTLTSVYTGSTFGVGRPAYEFGVAINGVNMEPSAMEAFENRETGERNFEWTKEALSTAVNLGDDCNNAHVQPTGKYHYHGTPHGITEKADGKSMFLVAWAADGFPVYYKYGYQDPSNPQSTIVTLRSSYQLKNGQRPGDGISSPNGAYDGTYVRDFEYVKGNGDLDEANGRFGITPEFPEGTYYYVITDEFPSLPRFFVGTPSDDFKLGNRDRHNEGRPKRSRNDNRNDSQRNNQRPSPDQLFQHMDSNRDGKLNKQEVKGPLQRDFDRIDKNKDGFITKDELKR